MNGGRHWMKGQLTMEELLSLAVYLALLSMLISAALSLKGGGEQWAASVSAHSQAFSVARSYDSFSNSNIAYPDSWEGGGKGYVEVAASPGSLFPAAPGSGGGDKVSVPVLRGIAEYAEGEPV
jgi:hypothetical protein